MNQPPHEPQDTAPHLSTDEARAGATTHMTRYVSAGGLAS